MSVVPGIRDGDFGSMRARELGTVLGCAPTGQVAEAVPEHTGGTT